MATELTEKYPPTKERMRQLLKKEDELRRLKLEMDLKPFVDEMKENLFILLVNKPFSDWPSEARVALEHAGKKYPMLREMYLLQLP